MEKDIEQHNTVAPSVKPASHRMPFKRLILLPLFAGALVVYNTAVPKLQDVQLGSLFSTYTSLTGTHCRHESELSNIKSRAVKILAENPLIDGHNDLLIGLRGKYQNHLTPEVLERFENGTLPGQTTVPSITAGGYGGAFWSAYLYCQKDIWDFSDAAYAPIVRATFEQIDTFHRLAAIYPQYFGLPASAASAEAGFHTNHTLISPIAIEGLHQIGNSLSILRSYHQLGVRYATMNWNCHNVYSDAAVLTYIGNGQGRSEKATPYWGGVSKRGRDLVKEMNRLGMIVDLSHVSVDTMRDVLAGYHNYDAPNSEKFEEDWTGSLAPPFFSHSSAYAVCPHPRNVPEDVLYMVKKRNSVVMINFNPGFISCTAPDSDSPTAMPVDYPANSTLAQIVRHITYIGDLIGYDHVGIGSDFNGIEGVPVGMEDISKFPDLVAELLKYGVSDADVIKVIGGNVLRVWAEVEKVAESLQKSGMKPVEDDIPRGY